MHVKAFRVSEAVLAVALFDFSLTPTPVAHFSNCLTRAARQDKVRACDHEYLIGRMDESVTSG